MAVYSSRYLFLLLSLSKREFNWQVQIYRKILENRSTGVTNRVFSWSSVYFLFDVLVIIIIERKFIDKLLWILNTLPNGVTHLTMLLIDIRILQNRAEKTWILNTLPNGGEVSA